MPDSVATFLKTGHLGPIQIGMSIEQLEHEVEPATIRHFWQENQQRPYFIWGDPSDGGYLLVNLIDDCVSAIWLYWYGGEPTLPLACGHYDVCLTRNTTFDQFQVYLKRHRIKWKIYAPLTFVDKTTIETESGARASFTFEQNPFYGILLTEKQ